MSVGTLSLSKAPTVIDRRYKIKRNAHYAANIAEGNQT